MDTRQNSTSKHLGKKGFAPEKRRKRINGMTQVWDRMSSKKMNNE